MKEITDSLLLILIITEIIEEIKMEGIIGKET